MGKLLESPFYISSWEAIPWHENNVNTHLSWCPRLREITLTLFTKDHQKVVKLKDSEYPKLSQNEKWNWVLIQRREWQLELKALYQNMGD